MAHRQSPHIQLDPSDQLALNERLDPCHIVVSQFAMPEGQVEWDRGCRIGILADGLCSSIQECSIVVIDGRHKDRCSRWSTECHVTGVDIDNKARVVS